MPNLGELAKPLPKYVIATVDAPNRGYYRRTHSREVVLTPDIERAEVWRDIVASQQALERIRHSTILAARWEAGAWRGLVELAVFEMKITYRLGRV